MTECPMGQSKSPQIAVVWGNNASNIDLRGTHSIYSNLCLQYAFSIQHATLERTAQHLRRRTAQHLHREFHHSIGALIELSTDHVRL